MPSSPGSRIILYGYSTTWYPCVFESLSRMLIMRIRLIGNLLDGTHSPWLLLTLSFQLNFRFTTEVCKDSDKYMWQSKRSQVLSTLPTGSEGLIDPTNVGWVEISTLTCAYEKMISWQSHFAHFPVPKFNTILLHSPLACSGCWKLSWGTSTMSRSISVEMLKILALQNVYAFFQEAITSYGLVASLRKVQEQECMARNVIIWMLWGTTGARYVAYINKTLLDLWSNHWTSKFTHLF